MTESIYLLIDHREGEVTPFALETIAAAQSIPGSGALYAVILGSQASAMASRLSDYPFTSVILVEDEKLDQYNPDRYVACLARLLREDSPGIFMMAHTYQNLDMAPRLAARMDTALITDCVGFQGGGESLRFIRQMFRNKVNATIEVNAPHPWIVTIQAGAFSEPSSGTSGEVQRREISLDGIEVRQDVLETFQGTAGTVDLSKAEIVVAVGRGIKKRENLQLVEELAEVLGAEIGASRPVVDNEWLGRERQIGSSGQTVAPRLYIGLGISGAIQHVVGMKGSDCIVAVNQDPNAPIFSLATYGIVGDLFEIVPALIKRLKEEQD